MPSWHGHTWCASVSHASGPSVRLGVTIARVTRASSTRVVHVGHLLCYPAELLMFEAIFYQQLGAQQTHSAQLLLTAIANGSDPT